MLKCKGIQWINYNILCQSQAKADKYIALEELTKAKQSRREKEENYKRKELDSKMIDYKRNLKSRKPKMDARGETTTDAPGLLTERN